MYGMIFFRDQIRCQSMGRRKKTLLQAVRASVLAHKLAVLVGVKPNGHQLARWYERRLALPHESECNSTWVRFLKGTMPQDERLAILLKMEPTLIEMLHHPLWWVLGKDSDSVDVFAILENDIYPTKTSYLSSLRADMGLLSAVDNVALYVSMLSSAEDNQHTSSLLAIWLADSYAQLKLETEWQPLSEVVWHLISIRLESRPWFSVAEVLECTSAANHKFWRDVLDDYTKRHLGSDVAEWRAWCSAVSRLDWWGRQKYLAYVKESSRDDSPEKVSQRETIYTRVRDRRYKLVRRARMFSINFLRCS